MRTLRPSTASTNTRVFKSNNTRPTLNNSVADARLLKGEGVSNLGLHVKGGSSFGPKVRKPPGPPPPGSILALYTATPEVHRDLNQALSYDTGRSTAFGNTQVVPKGNVHNPEPRRI